MASYMQSAPKFCENDDWSIYEQQLEQFFVGYEIKDERKPALLLTAVSTDVFRTLTNMCFPKLPKEKTYAELCKLLKKQFSPVISIYAERAKFYDSRQNETDTVTDWLTRLRSLAVRCEFGDHLEFALKDKFITGIRKGPIVDKLYELEPTESFEKCVEAALKRELTANRKGETVDINKLNMKFLNKHSSKTNNTIKNSSACFACGKSNHDFKTCKYKSYKCKNCTQVGHLASVCKNTTKKTSNFLSANNGSPNPNDCAESDADGADNLYLFNMDTASNTRNNQFVLKLNVNNVNVVFEMDTGAAVSVCSKELYDRFFSNVPMNKSNMVLKSYDGSVIRPAGSFNAKVKYNEREYQCEFLVICNGGKPLIGRDILNKINFKFTINSIASTDIDKLTNKYKELFENKLGCYRYGKAKFEIMDNVKPIFIKPRRVPLAFQADVNNEIDQLVREGVLTLVENSDWGTPIVPILKNGKLRVCVDYKSTINSHLKDIKCVLPNIEDLFAALCGGVYFSKLDLRNAYNQIEVDSESRLLLAWSTHKGVYACNRMSFGAKTACAIFQSTMSKLLQGCPGVIVFFDDILVTGKTIEEHIRNLENVFKKLAAAGFILNLGKCNFFQQKVKYLGHVIDADGLHKDEDKVKAIVNAPAPSNPTEVKAFIGLVNYYSRFFPNLAQILFPIYELLKKTTEFAWSNACSESFELVKKIIASDKVLAHYNPHLPIKVVCDASQYGIGAAMFHTMENGEDRPIAFASKTLTKAQRNYSTIDREALAIFFGVKKFQHYLIGRKFLLQTDHKPLTSIFGDKHGIPTMAASRLQRWSTYLASFTFDIEYIVGKSNVNADFLSRMPTKGDDLFDDDENNDEETTYLNFIDQVSTIDRTAIHRETATDSVLSVVINFVKNGWPAKKSSNENIKPYECRANELSVEKDILMWGYRVIVPSSLRKDFLQQLHTSHSGVSKMKAKARSHGGPN